MPKLRIIVLFLFLSILVSGGYIYLNKQIQDAQEKVYVSASVELHERIKNMIEDKKKTLLKIVLTLSQYELIKDKLLTKDSSGIDLKKISLRLKKHSAYQSIWFQIVDKEGKSFYRTWTKKRGDSVLKARLAVVEMMQSPQVKSIIGVGKFDLSFKAMVPIFYKGKYIGLIEGIAKFNSIAENLQKAGIKTLFLVDSRYKKQLLKPFTKHFIDDYYVANVNADDEYIRYLQDKGLKKVLNDPQNYFIDTKRSRLVIRYKIQDIKNKDMAYFILSKSIDDINFREVSELQNYFFLFFISIFTLIFFTIVFNVIRRKNTALEHEAHHDTLTKLPNRCSFMKCLESKLLSKNEHKEPFALLFIDLDQFKEINDTYGHDVGDEVLIQSGERITSLLREKDSVARLGGDEFTVIIDNLHKEEDLIPIMKRMAEVFEEPMVCLNHKVKVMLSIGVATYPKDGTTAKDLIKYADIAMYQSKRKEETAFTFC